MNNSLAFALDAIALVLWGSWGNMFKIAGTRFEIFFLDYVLGNLLVAGYLLPWQWTELSEAGAAGFAGYLVLGAAAAAGTCFAVATLCLVSAIDLAGMALVLPLTLGIEFVIGVPFSMFTEGFGSAQKTACSFVAVLFVLVALACDHLCHVFLKRGSNEPLLPRVRQRRRSSLYLLDSVVPQHTRRRNTLPTILTSSLDGHQEGDVEASKARGRRSAPPDLLQAALCDQNEPGEVPSVDASCSRGLALAVLAGLLFSIWPCFADISQGKSAFDVKQSAISPESFFVTYVASAQVITLVILPIISRHPLHDKAPISFWPEYMDTAMLSHCCGITAGVMQGTGTLLTMVSSTVLGTSIAMAMTRCSPVVAAMWGTIIWKELQGADGKTWLAFGGMLVAYVVAVLMLAFAGNI